MLRSAGARSARALLARSARRLFPLAAAIAAAAAGPAHAIEFFDGRVQIHGYSSSRSARIARRLRRQRRLGSLAVVQHRRTSRRECGLRAERLRPLRPISALRARRGALRLHLDQRLRHVQSVERVRRTTPSSCRRRISSAHSDGFIGVIAARGLRRHAPAIRAFRSTSSASSHGPSGLDRPRPAASPGSPLARARRRRAVLRRRGSDSDGVARRRSRPSTSSADVAGRGVPVRAAQAHAPTGRRHASRCSAPSLPENRVSRHRRARRSRRIPFNAGDVQPGAAAGSARARASSPSALASARSAIAGRRARRAKRRRAASSSRTQPSRALMREGRASTPSTRTSARRELAWNHGASQQDEKELKEAYLDLEMFDSRLWLRARQAEHRLGQDGALPHQDQFNPQDLALASLADPRGVAHRAVGAARRLVVLRRGPARGRAPRAGGELRPVRADRHRPLRRALRAEPGAATRPFGALRARPRGLGARRRDAPAGLRGTTRGASSAARASSSAGSASASRSPTSAATTTSRYVDPVFVYARNVDPRTGRPRRGRSQRRLRSRRASSDRRHHGLSRRLAGRRFSLSNPAQVAGRAERAPREPAALPRDLRVDARLQQSAARRAAAQHLELDRDRGSERPLSPRRALSMAFSAMLAGRAARTTNPGIIAALSGRRCSSSSGASLRWRAGSPRSRRRR